MIMRALCPQDR